MSRHTLTRRRFVVSATASAGAVSFFGMGCDGLPADGDGGVIDDDDAGIIDDDDAGITDPPRTGPGPEPETLWEAPGAEDALAFATGVQIGDVLPTAALVSVQTTRPSVRLVLVEAKEEGWVEIRTVDALTATDGHIAVELIDLYPDTTYAMAVFDESDAHSRSRVTRFRTAPRAGESRIVRFGATSCLGGNRPWPNMSGAVSLEPLDFFVLLGDTIYADSYANDAIGALWRTELAHQGLRDVSAHTSLVAAWDDHELDNNWSYTTPGVPERFDIALREFRRHLPQRVNASAVESWRVLSWGDTLDVFVLDCRGERIDGNYISPAQMAWMKEKLAASTARFKIMVNSVPITAFPGIAATVGADDRWQGHPAQRSEILSFIADNQIGGVLWLAGDFHIGGIGFVDAAGGPAAGTYEVLAGPAGSSINPAAALVNEDERLVAVIKTFNSTLFDCDPELGTIRVRFIGDAVITGGQVLRDVTLTVP